VKQEEVSHNRDTQALSRGRNASRGYPYGAFEKAVFKEDIVDEVISRVYGFAIWTWVWFAHGKETRRGATMKAKKSQKRKDPLEALLKAASPDVLRRLIHEIASDRPEVRRQCFEFLKKHVTLSPDEHASSEAEAAISLWLEVEPDLSELDEYGGGDYDLVDYVDELLNDLCEELQKKRTPRKSRQAILDEVLPYIRSGNGGMDDELYGVAYAACYDESDLRGLAQRFEAIGRDWPIDHARRIYRRIGDHQKYLELRSNHMQYGGDYHDLATFYWETGDREKALEVAMKGLKEAKGRMDELRSFLMERAQDSNDRPGYLNLQFDQATDGLTLKKYQAFKKLCTQEEWNDFEPRMLERLEKAWDDERMKIHISRKEYDKALSILKTNRYPLESYDKEDMLKVAAELEERYPEEILSFYMTGLGNLNSSLGRKTYVRKAEVMGKVRHMWVDVLKKPDRWKEFGSKVKQANLNRPAFQQEFAKVLSGWNTL